jgi:hypothetical protein
MPPFRFRLARVLNWYSKQCAVEESHLHACSAAVLATASEIARLQSTRAAMERETVGSPNPRARDLVALELFREHAKRDEIRLQEEFRKRQQALEAQRAVVEAARRRFRLLDKLRERRLTEYTGEFDKELEELAADAFRAASFRQTHSA